MTPDHSLPSPAPAAAEDADEIGAAYRRVRAATPKLDCTLITTDAPWGVVATVTCSAAGHPPHSETQRRLAIGKGADATEAWNDLAGKLEAL